MSRRILTSTALPPAPKPPEPELDLRIYAHAPQPTLADYLAPRGRWRDAALTEKERAAALKAEQEARDGLVIADEPIFDDEETLRKKGIW